MSEEPYPPTIRYGPTSEGDEPSARGAPAPSGPSPKPETKRSPLRVIAFVVLLVIVFVAVATATAVVILARRGTITLPWQDRPTPAASPTPDGEGGRRRVPPEGSMGRDGRDQGPEMPGPRADVFESALGYRVQIPTGWQVGQRARPGGGESAFDSFTNGRDGIEYASIQVSALEAPGIDVLQAASQVAAKAATQQGYSIMVQPQKAKFATVDAATFRAYAVQSGFPLIVEVYVVAAPDGRLLQIQFASSLEGFSRQQTAISAFEKRFEFRTG